MKLSDINWYVTIGSMRRANLNSPQHTRLVNGMIDKCIKELDDFFDAPLTSTTKINLAVVHYICGPGFASWCVESMAVEQDLIYFNPDNPRDRESVQIFINGMDTAD